MSRRPAINLFSPSFLVIHSTLAFGTGILLSYPDFPYHTALLVTTLGLGLGCLTCLHLAKSLSHPLTIIFFLFLGACHTSAHLAPSQEQDHISNLVTEQREVSLIAVVDTAPAYGIDRTTLIVNCREVLIPPAGSPPSSPSTQLRPVFKKTSGRIKLSLRAKPADILLPGDRILTRARIGPPQGFDNPGGFDLPRFLASQDIFTTGWISSAQSIRKIAGPPRQERLITYGPKRLRAQLISFLDHHLPEQHSALYRALITGDRTGLPPDLVELFRSLGIVHLLAISGLHMALLAGAVMAVSFWLLQRSETILLRCSAGKISGCAAILPLVLYCLVAGFQTPALRALLMILIFISALLSDRQWHGPTNISLAALAILIINPLAITTVSFQLSFAAVTGIILALPQARPYFITTEHKTLKGKIIQYTLGSLVVSLAASLATLPLLLFHFNRFALSGPLATIAIEPFLCMWSLGWGLPASLIAPLSPDLALVLFKIGGIGLDIALFLAAKLKPVAKSIWLPSPSLFQVALFYSGLFVFIKTQNFRIKGLAALCCLALFISTPRDIRCDQATILDVGQGNCTLIETHSGKVIMVDAGGPRSPSFDVGRQVIAPALWAKGIKDIDLLVLSHPDQDHYSGAAFLLEHFPTHTLWIPTTEVADPGWQKMLAIAASRHTDIHIPTAAEQFPLSLGRELSCLTDLHHITQEKQNNQSLVIKFTSGSHSLLMPGDIESEAERHLVDSQTNLNSDIIIAPHHGSASSSTTEFMAEVAAQTVIFSASRFKKPYFPAQAVQQRYREFGALPMLTAETGAITIIFAPKGLETVTQQ